MQDGETTEMAAKSVIGIRTNKWTQEERGLHARLTAVFGDNVYVVFHNRAADLDVGPNVVDINDDWVVQNELRAVGDWGWRCGDYAYYALRQAAPDAEYYWLIEPDVFFTSEPHSFFDQCSESSADVMGLDIAPFPRSIRFTRGLRGFEHYRAIFALTRLSGAAVDYLFAERQAYSKSAAPERAFTNDEIFVFSHAAREESLSQANLRDLAPSWFDGTQFRTNPDLLDQNLMRSETAAGKVWHPVRNMEHFKAAIVQRLCTSSGFLNRMTGSIQTLQPEDIDDIADQVRASVHNTLTLRQK